MSKLVKRLKRLIDGASDAELEIGFLLLVLSISLFMRSL